MDISKDYAHSKFELIANGKSLTNLQFKVENEDYAELIGSYTNADGNYQIDVKAKKTGATNIIATWEENGNTMEASFNLVITAKLKIDIKPNDIILNNRQSVEYVYEDKTKTNFIDVTSSDGKINYTKSNKLSWNFASSKIGEDDAFEINSKPRLTITSNGYNGSIMVTATYKYMNNDYSVSSNINITTNYIVGLKGDSFSEVNYTDSGFSESEERFYDSSIGPANSQSTYFVYERNGLMVQNLIDNIELEDIKLDTSKTVNIALLDKVDNGVSPNIYNSRGIKLIYKGNDSEPIKCNLIVSVHNVDKTMTKDITVPVTITPMPYSLILNADGGTVDGLAIKEIDLVHNENIDLSSYIATKDGYTFEGWYDDTDSKVDSIDNLEVPSKDITLTAKWSPKVGQIVYDNNIEDDHQTTPLYHTYNVFNDVSLPYTTRPGYTLGGYCDNSGNMIINKDGKIKDTTLFNKLLLENINNGTPSTLYAKWIKDLNITLYATTKGGTKTESKLYSYSKGTTLDKLEDLPTYDTNSNYIFVGYIDDVKNIVVDKYGNFEGGTYTLNSDLKLYALFSTTGYTKVESNTLDKEQEYLIASGDHGMSNTSLNGNNIDSISLVKENDYKGLEFIVPNDQFLTLKYNSDNSLEYSGEYLNGEYSFWSRSYSLKINTSKQAWNFESLTFKTTYSTIIDSYDIYLTYNEETQKFEANKSPSNNIQAYKKGDVLVDRYEPLNTGGTE